MQTALDRLCAHAMSADHAGRCAALAALATEFPGVPAGLDLVTGVLCTDPIWLVRLAAVRALAAGWPAASETARVLRERVNADAHHAVRAAALRELAVLRPGDRSVKRLLRDRAMADADERVRLAATQALSGRGKDRSDAEQWLRSVAAEADVDAVRQRVEDGSVIDVWALARHWRRSPDIGRFLHSCAATHASPTVRAAALEALTAEWRTDIDVESLLRERAIVDAVGDVRLTAIGLLADGWPDAADLNLFLRVRATDDPELHVRRTALDALARDWRDHPETLTLFRRLAIADPDPDLRTIVLTILTREWKSDPEAMNWLHERAREGDPQTRVATLEVLAGSDGSAETHLLLQERAVADPDEPVRQVALNILIARWYHDPQTRQFLHDNGYRPPRRTMGDMSGASLEEIGQVAQWVALTIASGVLGNATYDALKAGVQRLRHRGHNRAAAAASAEPAPAPVPLTADQALLLAHTAVLQRCEAIDIERPDLDRLRSTAYQDHAGRWVFAFRDAANRRFHVRIPPNRPAEGDVTVEIYIPPP